MSKIKAQQLCPLPRDTITESI